MSAPDQPSPSAWIPPSKGDLEAMLPQYEISELWAQGGMAAVYRGRQKSLNRAVAIKVLSDTFASGAIGADPRQFVDSFKLEAEAMAGLVHPAIINVYDFGQTEAGQFYIVMEFVDGLDIHNYLHQQGGRLPAEHAITITSHVLDALQYAHEKGVLHRDIKPSNVMISSEGWVKLADFGLAKRVAQDGEEARSTKGEMTLGTPEYSAPETLDGDMEPDARADIYAVGVMLYQLLTGKLPRGQFDPPSELVDGVDARLDAVISKALRANPERRYLSAAAFRSDLDEILTQPVPKAADPRTAQTGPSTLAAGGAPQPVLGARGGRGARSGRAPGRPAARPRPAAAAAAAAAESGGPHVMVIILAVAAVIALGIFLLNRPSKDTDSKPATPPASTGTPTPPGESEARPEPAGFTGPPIPLVPDPPPPDTSSNNGWNGGEEPEPDNPEPIATRIWETPDGEDDEPGEDPDEEPAPAEGLVGVPGLTDRLNLYLAARRKAVEDLATKYKKSLKVRMDKAFDSGLLDLGKAFQSEMACVEALQELLEVEPADLPTSVAQRETLPALKADAPAGLADLRRLWDAESGKIWLDLDAKLNQSLQVLQSDLTRSRDLEKAEWVKAYREELGIADLDSGGETLGGGPSSPRGVAGSLEHGPPTREKPFENSLGMRFVPVPIKGGPTDGRTVLFSIWELRRRDYAAFVEDRGRSWKEANWELDSFEETPDHPAVMISWKDTVAFCEWLTEKERSDFKIPEGAIYRLPKDHEWSCAVGIAAQEDPWVTPGHKDGDIDGFVWGAAWPPPEGAGNFCGEELANVPWKESKPINGYKDPYPRTSPVGSFAPNQFGLHDLIGNVYEWCEEVNNGNQRGARTMRGGCWFRKYPNPKALVSSKRAAHPEHVTDPIWGARLVLELP